MGMGLASMTAEGSSSPEILSMVLGREEGGGEGLAGLKFRGS